MINLEAAKILTGGVITPLKDSKDISKELSNDIYSGIAYVCEFKDCSVIKNLFAETIQKETELKSKEWQQWNTETGAIYP